jgi:hypothetical protein
MVTLGWVRYTRNAAELEHRVSSHRRSGFILRRLEIDRTLSRAIATFLSRQDKGRNEKNRRKKQQCVITT